MYITLLLVQNKSFQNYFSLFLSLITAVSRMVSPEKVIRRSKSVPHKQSEMSSSPGVINILQSSSHSLKQGNQHQEALYTSYITSTGRGAFSYLCLIFLNSSCKEIAVSISEELLFCVMCS